MQALYEAFGKLFDGDHEPKRAYWEVVAVAKQEA